MPPVSTNAANAPSVHRIDGALSIYTVTAVHAQLCTLLKGTGPLRVDISGLDECDCAGLQLLCSLKKSAKKLGRNVEWIGSSEALLHCARIAGFSQTEFQAQGGAQP